MPAYVDLKNVRRVFGTGPSAITALDDISFTIGLGEFVSILGPSGCGKSTVLKCAAGLDQVTSGTVSIHGEVIDRPPEDLGVVFQRDTLADWRTILDNVLLVSEFRRLDKATSRRQALELLDLFGLSEFASRRPWELSGGMRQRAAICRALVGDPALLLMDEPFGALDAMTRDQLNVELQRIWLRSRKSVMFITHSIEEAVFLSDKVIIMSRNPGRIVETIKIDLPRPRPLSIRQGQEFSLYVSRIRDLFLSLGILKDA